MKKWLSAGRLADVLAIAAVVFVAYRLFVVPRNFPTATAHPAPRVTYATLAGPPFELFKHRGHVVFLDFFASWCEPCKISLPWAEKFARSHPEVEVVPVDVGEPRAVAGAFARAHSLHNVALDTGAFSSGFFDIHGFPTMVVIDPQGRIRATWEGLNPALALNMEHATAQLSSSRPPLR